MDEKLIEAVARAILKATDTDPDSEAGTEEHSFPLWMTVDYIAKAVLAVAAPAIREAALREAAAVADGFFTARKAAHDMRSQETPKRGDGRKIAAAILALKERSND